MCRDADLTNVTWRQPSFCPPPPGSAVCRQNYVMSRDGRGEKGKKPLTPSPGSPGVI